MSIPMKLTFPGGQERSIEKDPLIMGILNVTPDSFSDGGRFQETERAVERALDMITHGADIIDIGGESTRPGAEPVPTDRERKRVLPVIKELRSQTDIPISIDTRKPKIAREAIQAGASMINDVGGLQREPEMAEIAAEYHTPVVAMHMQKTPGDMQNNPTYDAVLDDIIEFFTQSKRIAQEAGVAAPQLILDPGIGFGKTLEHNCKILRDIDRLHVLNCPVMLGTSRKSFIEDITGETNPRKRVAGSLASMSTPIQKGVQLFRVHDVKAMKQFLDVLLAIQNHEPKLINGQHT